VAWGAQWLGVPSGSGCQWLGPALKGLTAEGILVGAHSPGGPGAVLISEA
jgi:hypothetical protein